MKFLTILFVFMFMFMELVTVSVSYAEDKKEAIKYSEECKDKNAKSCYKLGLMYASGDGVKQDESKAKEFYKKACDGGSSEGCVSLEMLNSANKVFNLLGI